MKWGKPCYCYKNANVAIVQGFKDFCALMFFKGVLMSDPKKVLKTQEKTLKLRCDWNFTAQKKSSN